MVWHPAAASELRPGDVIRDPRFPGDGEYKVVLVDRFDGQVYLYLDGQPDAVVFARDALFERKFDDLGSWLDEQDALHSERLGQGGY